MDISRRELFKMAGVAAFGATVGQFSGNVAHAAGKKILKLKAAPVVGSKNVTDTNYTGTAAKVYFTDKFRAYALAKKFNISKRTI